MRDAFGGIVNIAMIVVFLVVVSGYLAFNVNYTKAFRVKNKIISTIEEYEGNLNHDDLEEKISDYMKSVGYSAPNFSIDPSDNPNCDKTVKCEYGYCVQKCLVSDGSVDTKKRAYFKVTTQINIDIPIINKIMPELKIFQVSGDTKPIVVR